MNYGYVNRGRLGYMAAEKVGVSDLHMYVCIIYLCIKNDNEYQTLTPHHANIISKGKFTTCMYVYVCVCHNGGLCTNHSIFC